MIFSHLLLMTAALVMILAILFQENYDCVDEIILFICTWFGLYSFLVLIYQVLLVNIEVFQYHGL